MSAIVLLGALAADPVSPPPESDLRGLVLVHVAASAALASWTFARRARDDGALLPWTALVTELTLVPAVPRIAQGRWSPAIVWGCAILATAAAGRVVSILDGDRSTVTTIGLGYWAPMALSGAALVTF
ncbi:MAG: hypothetical protein HYV09_26685 [Deltaproteobacteria bacterium]|nr:hypothetical protein [Deltaproteobacteria bacterium]